MNKNNKNLEFHEENLSRYSKERLQSIYQAVTFGSWQKYIYDLELALDSDTNEVIVRGRASKEAWNRFMRVVVKNNIWNYLYQ